MPPRFHTSGGHGEPRAPQREAQRRHIHGGVLPMATRQGPEHYRRRPILSASAATVHHANWLVRMLAVVAIALVVMTILAPGGIWMAERLLADFDVAVSDATAELERPVAP